MLLYSKISRRGKPKILTRDKKVTFNTEKAPYDWQLKPSDPALHGKNFTFPVKNRIEELLSETFILMKDFSIVFNPIEAKNSTIKHAIPLYGLKTPERLQRRLTYHSLDTTLANNHEQYSSNIPNPLPSKCGFVNLLQFFLPQIVNIEGSSSW